jgi:hypothetical protein
MYHPIALSVDWVAGRVIYEGESFLFEHGKVLGILALLVEAGGEMLKTEMCAKLQRQETPIMRAKRGINTWMEKRGIPIRVSSKGDSYRLQYVTDVELV